jgi:transketolase
MEQILSAFAAAAITQNKPTVIIAKTIMGKGIRSIEGDYKWHGKVPSADQVAGFLEELYNIF